MNRFYNQTGKKSLDRFRHSAFFLFSFQSASITRYKKHFVFSLLLIVPSINENDGNPRNLPLGWESFHLCRKKKDAQGQGCSRANWCKDKADRTRSFAKNSRVKHPQPYASGVRYWFDRIWFVGSSRPTRSSYQVWEVNSMSGFDRKTASTKRWFFKLVRKISWRKRKINLFTEFGKNLSVIFWPKEKIAENFSITDSCKAAQGAQPLVRSSATQKRNARAFHQAPQDAQTGQPKLTRIEVRH